MALLLLSAVVADATAFAASLPKPVKADPPLRLAVASSVRPVVEKLVAAYAAQSDRSVSISSGASGVLFAQIVAGAPFDLFLAADSHYPAELVRRGLGLAGSRSTYVHGRLVLLCDSPCDSDDAAALDKRLLAARRIAVANPDTAPFGKAAFDYLAARDLLPRLRHKLAMGNNAGQAYQFFHTGNAELAFVSGSQALADGDRVRDLSTLLAAPIQQQLVVLSNSLQQQGAVRFADFVASAEARDIFIAGGYTPLPLALETTP